MDDLMSKIQSVLSDEESMNQIKQLAQMLSGSQGDSESGGGEPSQTAPPPDLSALFSGMGGKSQAGGFDPVMLLQLGELFKSVSANDKDAGLLLALKPHLKPERQERIDKAVKILRLLALFTAAKESGLLKSIDLF